MPETGDKARDGVRRDDNTRGIVELRAMQNRGAAKEGQRPGGSNCQRNGPGVPRSSKTLENASYRNPVIEALKIGSIP